jgi:type III pantothenate kinase
VLLALDIGNTNVVGGLYDGPRLAVQWRVSTERERTADELGVLWDGLFRLRGLAPAQLRGVCIGSVVPSLTPSYVRLARDLWGVRTLVLGLDVDLGIKVETDHPAEVGVDRIANTLAAREKYGAPAIVVDFGTSTNFDVLSAAGSYIGGVIAPGLRASMDALASRAAQLFRVPLARPQRVIGRNTIACLQSGAFWGHVGLVEGVIRRIQEELGGQATVVATGGLATVIAPETRLIDQVDPHLTLDGIRLVWERNQEGT